MSFRTTSMCDATRASDDESLRMMNCRDFKVYMPKATLFKSHSHGNDDEREALAAEASVGMSEFPCA